MRKRDLHVTEAELKVMKIIWRLGSGTVRDVKDALARESGTALAYTTVMTLMNQLAAKGALEVDREREPYVYRALAAQENVIRQRLRHFLETVFDGQAGELMLRLVEEGDLSREDLARIEAKIDEREKATPKPASRRRGKARP